MSEDVVDLERARRLPVALLAYAAALALFLLIPPVLKASVGPPQGFTAQELVDLFTPIVVLPLVAGAIVGVTFFFVTVEGETTALGIPLSLLFVAWTARETLAGSSNPVFRFFLVSSAVTLLTYAAWAIAYGWPFAEPCAVLGC